MQTSQVGAVGIDFGSQRSVIAVAKKGGVEILANEGSHRETQNIIGFGEQERFIGEQGALQGRPQFFREEAKWLSVGTEIAENGKTQFVVNYQNAKQKYTAEQLTSSMLNKLKDIISKNNINLLSSNTVLSVPNYYTEQERKALLDACKVAEIPIERLVNESTAISTSYGLFRRMDLDQTTPRYVVFIDFGHSKTSAFVGSFTKEKAQIVAQVNDRNLGARDMDWALYEHSCEIFEQTSGGLTPKESKKAQVRLFETIEKQRKVLSANSEASISVEYLMEDIDFQLNLNREQFENLIKPVVDRFAQLMEMLALQIQNLKIKLHSIEIIGGASRIPIIQQVLTQVFKVETVSKTLNASECISRGCAMMAAKKNPQFRVIDYEIEEANFYTIRVGWLYNNTLDAVVKQQGMEIEEGSGIVNFFPDKQHPVLFDYNCAVPSLKSFNLSRTDNVELTVFYDPVPIGFQPIIQQVRIPAIKPTHPEFYTKIRIRLNQHGLIQLEDVCLYEDYMEDVKVPKEKPKDVPAQQPNEQKPDTQMQEEKPAEPKEQPKENAEEEFEIKKKKKQQSTLLNCDVSSYYSASKQEIGGLFEIECNMLNQDKLTHETYQRKNELESYIYNNKSNFQGKLQEYTVQADQANILKALDTQYEWLYGDGTKSSKSQYASRLEQLKVLCEPANLRFKDFNNTPDYVNELVKGITQVQNFSATTDDKFSHITVEERFKVVDECVKARSWCENVLSSLAKGDKTKKAEFTVSDVEKFRDGFFQRTSAIMNRPKPAPVKEEPKKDAQPTPPETKPEQQQQGKMETE